jgi:hypothetical protein
MRDSVVLSLPSMFSDGMTSFDVDCSKLDGVAGGGERGAGGDGERARPAAPCEFEPDARGEAARRTWLPCAALELLLLPAPLPLPVPASARGRKGKPGAGAAAAAPADGMALEEEVDARADATAGLPRGMPRLEQPALAASAALHHPETGRAARRRRDAAQVRHRSGGEDAARAPCGRATRRAPSPDSAAAGGAGRQ